MPRATDLPIRIGLLPPGPTNSVLDVPGVGLGHATVWRDEPDPPEGRGVARTGVTVLMPAADVFRRSAPSGGAILNGAGECTGFIAITEWGLVATPVFLTSTMQVGRVYDAACELLTEAEPLIGEEVVIPVVAECDDSWLNEVRRMQVSRADVAAAWDAARASVGSAQPPPEGAVGAGTGMSCLGWKGGIGTASRVVPAGHVVGVLLLTNFGDAERLTIDGAPVGRAIEQPPEPGEPAPAGSCIGVVVTDAPLDSAACARLARRVGLGLARTGSTAHHGSGEIFLAFATGVRAVGWGRLDGPTLAAWDLDPLFAAVVEATEEAVLNSMLQARTVRGRAGHGRVDLRGTGSSEGVAVDEYPPQEQADLREVIAWLAAQPWCTGAVGMYGTSYSGFNALQVAATRPPALKAVIAIYASDDRHTDDVHYMGGALRLLDLVDYCHYMTPMTALPPVPAVYGPGWREEWQRRLDALEPWLLTWLAHQRDDAYWRHGSLRPAYYRITCPTMIVAGWADGYRNNSLRTIAALRAAGVPSRLLIGPWSHMATHSSRPGPRIDLVPEMARWWNTWLRDEPADATPRVVWFARRSTRAEPDLDTVAGEWRSGDWPDQRSSERSYRIAARPPYNVRADVGTAAWISCAGHLPYGQPADQRHDDAESLTWDWPADDLEVLEHSRLRLRLMSSRPVATVSAKLCDVSPDGASALVARGLLNLTRRESSAAPIPMNPGQEHAVEVELEATSWRWSTGHTLRLAVAGADWPNTIAPPQPLTLEVRGGELILPVIAGPAHDEQQPSFAIGGPAEPIDADVVWRVERDVLARQTSCTVEHGSTYETPYGTASEQYSGRVSVDTVSLEQHAHAVAAFELVWPEATVRASATLDFHANATAYDVDIGLEVHDGAAVVATRCWNRTFARDLA